MRFLFALIFCGALSASPLLAQEPSSTVPPAAAESGKDVVHALNNAFAKVFEIVAPSVVIIEVSKKNDGNEGFNFDDLFFQGQPDDNSARRGPRNLQPIQSEGSGFIVRSDGYILTNFHVVEGADHVDVKLKDGREFAAKVAGTDEKTDIAVLKIEAKDLPVVQMADSDVVRVGQFAFAIGAPFKLDYTFTYGVISGKGRSKLFTNGGYSISDYIQTDASINPGNSGGPLCDIDGKVIGMNTLINGLNRGLGFAIPSNLADFVGQVARNSEAKAAVQSINQRVHADDLAVDVAERTTGVTRINRGIGLDVIGNAVTPVGKQFAAAFTADHAIGESVI